MSDQVPKLVSSTIAARSVGVDRTTLWRWQQAGSATPELITPGGQARWDIDQLKHQIHAMREAPLSETPTTPEKQPVAAAIVTCERGVLAGRRNDGVPPWTFIAGKLEIGESPADAAIREVKEETGLEVVVRSTIGRRVHPHTGRTMIYLDCVPANNAEPHNGDPEELAEVRWLSLAEADELMPGMFEPVHEHLAKTL